MTTIAWDGYRLSADKRSNAGNMMNTVTKVRKLTAGPHAGGLVGGSGDMTTVMEMFAWLEAGAVPEKLPEAQKKDFAEMIVVTREKKVLVYENSAYPIHIENTQYAGGSGRAYALAGMKMGLPAPAAVALASEFDPGTGNGIDTLSL